MESTRRTINWINVLTTWAIGLLAIIGSSALLLLAISLLDLTASGEAGRIAITLGLATFASVLLVGVWRLARLRDPLPTAVAVAALHVATFVIVFLVDLTIRLATDTDGFAPLDGTVAEQAGPASAIVAIMSIAAIAASMLALSTTPTEDEVAGSNFHRTMY